MSHEGWLYGSKVTYIDLAFFGERFPSEVLAKFPGLKALVEKVGALPNIAKWVKERPKHSTRRNSPESKRFCSIAHVVDVD